MIRASIEAGHRFDSFADQRSHNFVKWSVLSLARATSHVLSDLCCA